MCVLARIRFVNNLRILLPKTKVFPNDLNKFKPALILLVLSHQFPSSPKNVIINIALPTSTHNSSWQVTKESSMLMSFHKFLKRFVTFEKQTMCIANNLGIYDAETVKADKNSEQKFFPVSIKKSHQSGLTISRFMLHFISISLAWTLAKFSLLWNCSLRRLKLIPTETRK